MADDCVSNEYEHKLHVFEALRRLGLLETWKVTTLQANSLAFLLLQNIKNEAPRTHVVSERGLNVCLDVLRLEDPLHLSYLYLVPHLVACHG